VLHLGDEIGAGVARADHDERAPGGPLAGLGGVGQLQLLQDEIA